MAEQVYQRYMGDGFYCYIMFDEKQYHVFETTYSINDDFLESFTTFEEAKKYADNLC